MKVQSVLLVALVAACALCAVQAAEPDAAQGPRWGFFRLQRLKGKLDEYSSDLTEAQKEEHRMHAWAKQFCGLTKDVYNKRVARAKASLTEWTDILNLRSKLVEYHKKRHIVYEDTHQYAKDGPASRRSFLQTCKAVDCPERWCKANPQECDRWTETRKHYFAANFQDHLARHSKVTLNAETRLKEAHIKVRLAAQRVQDLRQSRTEAVQKCHDHVNKIKARFTARVTFLSTNVKSLNEAIVKLKAARAKREAAYRPFYMTKCHHLGGQHHAYNCVLDVHNRDRAHHRFSYCKPRGAQESSLHTLAFRCYK